MKNQIVILSDIRLERDARYTVHVSGNFNLPLYLTDGDANYIGRKIFKGFDEPDYDCNYNRLERLEKGVYRFCVTYTFYDDEGLDKMFGKWDDEMRVETVKDITLPEWSDEPELDESLIEFDEDWGQIEYDEEYDESSVFNLYCKISGDVPIGDEQELDEEFETDDDEDKLGYDLIDFQ